MAKKIQSARHRHGTLRVNSEKHLFGNFLKMPRLWRTIAGGEYLDARLFTEAPEAGCGRYPGQ